ncbi:MAG TPA: hypothetical protein VK013_08820 [Myxococcaceae bacterium]|nr:hypothetical protein [Myxococcaceae bacterium]
MPTSARPSVRPLSGAPLLFVLLCLIGPAAWAQKAVVTDLRNDRRDRLQGQIAESLSRIEGLEVVSRAEWQKLAASKKITLVRSRNAAGVRALAPEARVSIAVTGTVNSAGTRFRVQLMNAKGEVLSTRVLNLRRRLLRPADLNRLGNAVLAAVQVAEPPAAPEAAPAAKAAEEKAEPETPTEPLVSDAPAPAEPSATAESPRPAGEVLGREPVISFRLSGSARWRSACMAPAVDSCVTYKSLEPADRPAGRFTEFSTEIPYSGVGLELLYFPFTGGEGIARGLGFIAGASRGWIEADLRSGPVGGSIARASITDNLVSAEMVWRFDIPVGSHRLWVGPRLGFMWRFFDVNAETQALLPDSDRRFPVGGIDAGFALSETMVIEASGLWAFAPGQTRATRRRFGIEGSSMGLMGSFGLRGHITGPVGYHVRLNVMGFGDTYESTGDEEEWTAGGIGSELYTGLELGISLAF